ncbi:hypothetical protein [Glycomyces arizonensis]|uniref:hypothetical protein n=1 Tax=Glycomyces arizonensis TaxID=256035 RepID=UPI0004016980|nr:hypothetical protein [Glycomyces arizonensis]
MYRALDLQRDYQEILTGQVLSPGEQVRWVSLEGLAHYEVEGREPNGDLINHTAKALMLVLKIVLAPLWIIPWLVLAVFDIYIGPGGGRPKSPPRSIAFGPQPDCMAAFDTSTPSTRGKGIWLLTDHRFARIGCIRTITDREERRTNIDRTGNPDLPLEPVVCKIEFQTPASEARLVPSVERELKGRFKPKLATYDRIALPDGSGFDFLL